MSIFAALKAMIERDGRAALVSVAGVRGSSPRDAGAHMAVRADGAFSGTIGGGALEWQALAEAQALLSSPDGNRLRTLDRSLGPDLGQCCGGRVALAIERLERADIEWIAPLAAAREPLVTVADPASQTDPASHAVLRRKAADRNEAALLPAHADRLALADGRVLERFGPAATALLLFGAGHVGRALALALAPLPFRVTWADPRPDAFPSHVPQNAALRRDADPASVLADAPDGAFVIVMTHSHALDLAVASAALSVRRFGFVGVIGSATKAARFASQMRQAGLDPALIETMACPVGLPGLIGKEPAVIAASVAAQALLLREQANAEKRAAATAEGFSSPDPSPRKWA